MKNQTGNSKGLNKNNTSGNYGSNSQKNMKKTIIKDKYGQIKEYDTKDYNSRGTNKRMSNVNKNSGQIKEIVKVKDPKEILSDEVMDVINKIRIDPKLFVSILENRLNYFKDALIYEPNNEIGPILTIEGKSAINEAIEFLKNQNSIPELIPSEYLKLSSKEHADDIGINSLYTHEGSDGLNVNDRIEKYCDWSGNLSENIEFSSNTSNDIICSWIIDDGIKNRTHRKNIFCEDYKYFGAGASNHALENIVTVVDFVGDVFGYNEINPNIINSTVNVLPIKFSDKDIKNTYQEIDKDAPDNALSVFKTIVSKSVNGKITKNIKKVYILEDGTQHKVEIEQ